jgi:hypothetical protein
MQVENMLIPFDSLFILFSFPIESQMIILYKLLFLVIIKKCL